MTGKSGIAGRRTALKLLSAAPLLTLPSWVSADAPDFPSREVRFVCAFPPGAGADVWVRFFVEMARSSIPKPGLVENEPGGNGSVATEYVARSKPDGHTILFQSPTSLAANMFMIKNPTVDVGKTMICVATMPRFSFYLIVDKTVPGRTYET